MLAFLAKGLFRDRSRSLFPLLTVAMGVSLVVLLDAYQRGAMDGIFRAMSSFVTGHLRVTTRAYAKAGTDATNELAMLGVDSILTELRHDFPEVTWTPRTRFGGLVDVTSNNLYLARDASNVSGALTILNVLGGTVLMKASVDNFARAIILETQASFPGAVPSILEFHPVLGAALLALDGVAARPGGGTLAAALADGSLRRTIGPQVTDLF